MRNWNPLLIAKVFFTTLFTPRTLTEGTALTLLIVLRITSTTYTCTTYSTRYNTFAKVWYNHI